MIGFDAHDHNSCMTTAVTNAQERCKQKGLQLTPIRQRVLEILLKEHRAMGAYDILEVLRNDGFPAQPPVAYRALDFLVSNGFAHKIEKLSAFVACTAPDENHTPAFLICTECDAVAEAPSHAASGVLKRSAEASGFQIAASVMEAEGICPNCQDNTAR